MPFSVIAAVDNNFGIGKAGKLPWSLKGDMAHFKEVTTRELTPGRPNVVIMGRTTWESLPEQYRPLKGRQNVVLSRQADLALPAGVGRFQGLQEALKALQAMEVGEVFVIGGGQVYEQAVKHEACNKIYLTHIQGEYDCDTRFPALPAGFEPVDKSEILDESGVKYQFVTYQRNA